MTTTDQSDGPTAPLPPAPSTRVLRRSRTDRVGAGVAGGLGEYFGIDPVLFRVLFATASFFGGAGVLAYLVAWAAIPEQGTENAPIDRFISELRRRKTPVWLVAAVAALVLWAVAFSWWAPGPVFPVMVIVIVLVALFGRHGRADGGAQADPADPGAINLTKDGDAQPSPDSPPWVRETRHWITEARAASRMRRRRAMPVRLATLGTLAATLTILGLIDGASGVALPAYFWATFGIVGLGLLVGLVLRRTPWTLAALLPPALIGLIAFAGSHARLHDGFGVREWAPTSATDIDSNYRLAFGQAKLDLRHIGPLDQPRTVHITLAAGQARILLPPTMNATVKANVHFGDVRVDGSDIGPNDGGFNLNRTIRPPATATGPALTIDVHVSDGQISIDRG